MCTINCFKHIPSFLWKPEVVKKLTTKPGKSAGNLSAKGSIMSTPCSPDTSPTKASVGPAKTVHEYKPIDIHCVNASTRDEDSHSRVNFEKMVMASLNKIIVSQEEIKNDLETFKIEICKTVEFQGEQITDLQTQSKILNS